MGGKNGMVLTTWIVIINHIYITIDYDYWPLLINHSNMNIASNILWTNSPIFTIVMGGKKLIHHYQLTINSPLLTHHSNIG